MKKLIVVAFMLLGSVFMASPAHADFGNMTYPEFQSDCTDSMTFPYGCSRAAYQSEVEGSVYPGCNCGGTVIDRWTGTGGTDWKRVSYPTNAASWIHFDYKYTNGHWRVGGKQISGGLYID